MNNYKSRSTEKRHVTPTRLVNEQGWSRRLIAKHLGDPDHQIANPHGGKVPMHLYHIDRVRKTTTNSPKLCTTLQANIQRRRNFNPDINPNALENAAQQLVPKLLALPTGKLDELIDLTEQHRMSFTKQAFARPQKDSSNNSDGAAQERAVAMIRHQYTNYDQLVDEIPYCNNRDAAKSMYQLIRTRTMALIAGEVPALAEACRNQGKEK